MIIVGRLLLLVGAVSLRSREKARVGGSSLMDNNPNFIYIGSFVALVGIVMAVLGIWPRPVMQAPAGTGRQT